MPEHVSLVLVLNGTDPHPTEDQASDNRSRRGLVRVLGLGVVTGAADDDCSAIGTYASAGSDLKKPWAAVAKAAGLEGVRIHDLRHSFASFGAGASMGLPIIGKLLGHSQPATTARYAHLDADPMRRAVETISLTIAGAMAGSRVPSRLRRSTR
jgi:hypothetical protein